jgi:hypothetical protein
MVMKQASPAQLTAEEIDTNDNVLLLVRVIRNSAKPLADVVVVPKFHHTLSADILLQGERSLDGVLVRDPSVVFKTGTAVLAVPIESDYRLCPAKELKLATPTLNVTLNPVKLCDSCTARDCYW